MKVKNVIKGFMIIGCAASIGWSLWCLKHDLKDADRRFPDVPLQDS